MMNPHASSLPKFACGIAALALAALFVPAIAQDAQPVDWSTVPPPARVPAGLRGAPAAAPAAAAQPVAEFTGFEGAVAPASLTAEQVGQAVVVTGTIVSVKPSWSERAPTTLVLQAEPAVSVVYWQDMADEVEGGGGPPSAGKKVSVRGKLQDWRGALQIKPESPGDLVIEGVVAAPPSPEAAVPGAPAAAPAPAAGLPGVIGAGKVLEHIDQPVVLVGTVAEMRDAWSERAPSILTLKDATGSTEVVFWADTREKMNESLLKPGTALVLSGIAGEYRERPQVRLAAHDAILAVDADNVAAQAGSLYKIAKAAAAAQE